MSGSGQILVQQGPVRMFTVMFDDRTVFCAWVASSGFKGNTQQRAKDKVTLAGELVKDWIQMKSLPAAQGWELRPDSMGKPHLLIAGSPGPAVSFTYSEGMTWAAMAAPSCGVGIDAADSSEFLGTYPFHRAFRDGELNIPVADRSMPQRAALAWSIKEAAVKALGYGFHLVDPLDVVCEYVSLWEGSCAANPPLFLGEQRARKGSDRTRQPSGYELAAKVRVVGKSAGRIDASVAEAVCVQSFGFWSLWVSIALVGPHSG